MCGLIGMVGTLEHKHRQAMKDLFFLDTLRGKDSTGLSAVDRDRRVSTRKFTVPGYEFIEYPVVERAMKHQDQLWIGHNRFKTTGEIKKTNAHPFEVLDENGDILLVGAHNGTLNNKYQIEQQLNEKFDTDSEALFNLFVKAPNYKEAIGKLKGAWSLVWWDPTTDSIHFCRNDQRPMHYAWTKDRKVLVWASEAWMIINACSRNGVELAENKHGLRCYATSPDTLYTLEIPQAANRDLPDLVKEGGYVGAPDHVFQGGWNRWQEWWADPNSPDDDDAFDADEPKADAKVEKENKANRTEDKENVVLGFPPPKKHFAGKNYSDKEIQELKDKGCSWCGDPFLINEPFEFLEAEALVCTNCVRDKHPKVDAGGRLVWRGAELDDPLPAALTDPKKLIPALEAAGLDLRPNGVFEDRGAKGGVQFHQKDSPEYKRLIEAAVSAAEKAVG